MKLSTFFQNILTEPKYIFYLILVIIAVATFITIYPSLFETIYNSGKDFGRNLARAIL